MLYPQNGDSYVTIDYVTSLHPVYCRYFNVTAFLNKQAPNAICFQI